MILVYGTICIDRIRRIEELPGPGGYAEVQEERLMLGGEAANTALALKTWGAEVILAGNPLGTGSDGDLLESLLLHHGLSCELLKKGIGETPVCDVYVTPDGERTMFGMGFKSIGREAKPETAPYRAGDWFTIDPNFGEVARDAVRRAASAGMKLYLLDFIRADDPIPKGSFWQSSTDWAGKRGEIDGNLSWVEKWVRRYESSCILTDGALGFAFGSPELAPRWYPAFPAEDVVDSTGAGDIFRAGMLYGLDEGWPISECLKFASSAGALKCRGLGGTGYVPSRSEVEDWISKNKGIAESYA